MTLTRTITQTHRHYVDSKLSPVDVDVARILGFPLIADCRTIWIPGTAEETAPLPMCPDCERLNAPGKSSARKTAAKPDLSGLPHYVYRLYDRDGLLLYVGLTYDPRSRRVAHRSTKEWWGEVASFRLTVYPTRAHAARVEAVVIWAEEPKHNKQGRGHYPVAAESADPAMIAALVAFDASYTETHGDPPTQTVRRREALRLLKAESA